MKRNTVIWIIVIIIVLIVIGLVIANMSNQPQSVPAASIQPATDNSTAAPVTVVPAQQPATVLNLSTMISLTLGSYVIAPNGMTLYTSSGDKAAGVSNCTGTCATSWPPYIVSSTSTLNGGSAITGAISTVPRADGSRQVTYKGMPLYFWQGDAKPGDTTGQGVNGFSVAKP